MRSFFSPQPASDDGAAASEQGERGDGRRHHAGLLRVGGPTARAGARRARGRRTARWPTRRAGRTAAYARARLELRDRLQDEVAEPVARTRPARRSTAPITATATAIFAPREQRRQRGGQLDVAEGLPARGVQRAQELDLVGVDAAERRRASLTTTGKKQMRAMIASFGRHAEAEPDHEQRRDDHDRDRLRRHEQRIERRAAASGESGGRRPGRRRPRARRAMPSSTSCAVTTRCPSSRPRSLHSASATSLGRGEQEVRRRAPSGVQLPAAEQRERRAARRRTTQAFMPAPRSARSARSRRATTAGSVRRARAREARPAAPRRRAPAAARARRPGRRARPPPRRRG